jgi:xylulokinase
VSVDPSSRTLPVAANVSAYQQAYERYQQLVATL